MKNKEIRKIAKEKMKGKMGKAIGITLLYGLIMGIMQCILAFIPLLGNIATVVLTVPLAFGYMKQIMCLANGEEVGLVDFFKHGFENFGKVWCSNLWLALKCVVSIILMIVGSILAVKINPLIGIVINVGAVIWWVIVLFKYAMLNYTIAYDKDGLRAKELLEKAAKDGEGKIGRFICMGLYYGFKIFVISLVTIFVISMPLTLLSSISTSASSNIELLMMSTTGMIAWLLSYIIIAIFALIYSIRTIAACNEFYKINVLGEQEEKEIIEL